MNQTWENYKKTNFGPKFWPALPKFVPIKLFMSSTSNSSYTLIQTITLDNIKENYGSSYEKMAKKHNFGENFGQFGPNLVSYKFLHEFILY